MAYDLEEQEQIEEFRAFWNKHGNTILTVVTVVLFAVAGWRGWGWYQSHQSAKAAVVYYQLKTAVEAKDPARVSAATDALLDKFGRTVYAEMAALLASQVHADAGDPKAAKVPLQWLIDHGNDESFRLTARLQMAAVLIGAKDYDGALAVLDTKVPRPFEGLFDDRRGDALLAAGKAEEARKAYDKALAEMPATMQARRLVQLKLDTLGAGS